MIDHKRNNSVKIRNCHDSMDFHDLVKTLLVRMLRRKHKDNNICQIYTERNIEEPNESYPDIEVFLKKRSRKNMPEVYIYELQKNVTKNWTRQIVKKYENVNLIIVPLKDIKREWRNLIKQNISLLESPEIYLQEVLTEYLT